MSSFNKVIIVGNLTRDPELKQTGSGTSVTDIGVAVNDRRKKGDEWVEDTQFIDVTLWGRSAEVVAEYLEKGSPVLVEGRLQLDRWETEDGEKRSKLKVVGINVQMLGGKKRETVGAGASAGGGTAESSEVGSSDDILF